VPYSEYALISQLILTAALQNNQETDGYVHLGEEKMKIQEGGDLYKTPNLAHLGTEIKTSIA
jgi:hypothetical protein